MLTTRALIIAGALLAAALPVGSSAAPADDGAHPQRSEQACREAWNRSEASSSCRLRFLHFFPADFCKLGGDCSTADGGMNPFTEQTRLENVPLYRNCGGQLGFNC